MVDPRLPKFPVIEDKPSWSQIKEAIRQRDFATYGFVVASSALGGWYIPPKTLPLPIRVRLCAGTAAVGAFLGVLMLHDFGEARLRGYAINDLEVIKFGISVPPPVVNDDNNE
ncbi:hypothetical protein DYB37_000467 [Aphanomyces astaci]|uniref:NADH-ubiquinone oxidoreductase 21kDa subunit N-terminal domain-containing protein n=1 Tax=Aphanomyces astaci TaxID=112090 RepID=A0A418FI74_APHAT|nr:hypothetical protein DYB35_000350 [Aphanomyces astaci]RHZ30020.1 hypothetical protein DYB37_000467 [Aphanomyces astaci]